MNILVVNDDGIEAAGLSALANALNPIGTIYIAAPARQQSAKAHGISIAEHVRIAERCYDGAEMALVVDGTPADCVKLGVEYYKYANVDIDMIFSGINHGTNLGTDTLYSGTVGAAMEGAISGLPSVAISTSVRRENGWKPMFLETAAGYAAEIAKLPIFQNKIANKNPLDSSIENHALGVHFIREDHVILNINVPDMPREEINGVKIVPLSYREYDEWFTPGETESGESTYHYAGRPYIAGEDDPDKSDVVAFSRNYITVTPLQLDLTNYGKFDEIAKLFL